MAVTDGQLDVVVRFSTSNPDVVLRVERPSAITALTLKQRIRAELPPPASTGRLRLIHAGKVVQDAAALSKSLTHILTPPPPSANANGNDEDDVPISAKAKGKQPIRDESLGRSAAAVIARVYVHCSIGDALTSADLATEAKDAQEADDALVSSTQSSLLGNTAAAGAGAGGRLNNGQPETTTTPAPRGFDRLLSTGFTAAEVAALRTQFLAIQAHTHTPDTMPFGPELLALEEQWLDNGSNAAGGGGGEGGEGGGGFGAEDAGALEDMLHGNLIGFFWPVGAMFWLMREEGVWSRRKQISVLSGFLVNITFGFLRILN